MGASTHQHRDAVKAPRSGDGGRLDDWSPWFRLAVAILATWRLSHLIAHEDGPFDAIVSMRRRAGASALGRLMDCPYCLSIWIAVPFAFLLARTPVAWCAAALAISGGASLLERLGERRDELPPFTGA